MHLHLRTLRGELIDLELEKSENVEAIKIRLKDEYKIVPSNVHLLLDGSILKDQDVIDPNQLGGDKFIVIHEKNQALRVDSEFIRITKTPISIIDSAASLNTPETTTADQPQAPTKPEKKKSRENVVYEQSPQFKQTLELMKEILPQISEQKCISALRRFKYDGDAAINFFQGDEIFEEEEIHEEELPLPAPVPIVKPQPKIYDVSELKSFNFGEFKTLVDGLTNKEQWDLLRFLREFKQNNDVYFLTQVFFSCDKDYITAKQCIH